MKNADLEYFYRKEINRNEQIVTSIECLHEGNPFVGTLILTNHRLAFVRKATPGFEVLSIKSSLIVSVDQRIDRGLDFILAIAMEKFAHAFELRGIDMARKQAFVDLTREQFCLFGDRVLPTSEDRPSTHY